MRLRASLRRLLREVPGRNPSNRDFFCCDILFESRHDGVLLRGWWIPSKENNKTIILGHGGWRHRADPQIGMLDIARELNLRGYNILMFDFRGHGESGGDWVSVGPNEARDILGAFDWVIGRGIAPESIGILGFSLGAVAALLAADQEKRIRAIVSDSAFARYGWINQSIKDRLALKVFFGKLETSDPLDVIQRISAKILFINGAEDRTINSNDARILFNSSGDEDAGHQLWIMPGASHAGAFRRNPQEYISRVVRFFSDALEVV